MWVYNNAAIQTLEDVVERSTGEDFADFAETNLFTPLDMEVEFARDVAGNPSTYFGLQAGCLDLARLGLMVSRGGAWGSEQIVSSEFIDETISPSTPLNAGYGYLWWLNADDGWVQPDPTLDDEGVFFPEAPLDAYLAGGLGGQTLLVLPQQDSIVVRLGDASASADATSDIVDVLAAGTLDALGQTPGEG